MKRSILKVIGVTVLFASVFLFVSCSQSLQNDTDVGSIVITLPNGNSRLAASDFNTYKIVLTNSAGSEVQSASVSGGSHTFNNLLPDYYTVSVTGGFTDSDGTFYTIASGKDTAIVNAGETAQAYIVLKQIGFFVSQLSAQNNGWQDGNDESNSGASPISPYKNLQTAIEKVVEKNDGESEYTIYVKGTIYPRPVPNSSDYKMADFNDLEISKPLKLSIVGAGADATLSGLKADGGGTYGSIVAVKGANLNLTLTNLALNNGEAQYGGAICSYSGSGTMTINNCEFSKNSAGAGGAIFTYENTKTIINGGTFNENYTTLSSGGAIANAGELTIIDATLSENNAATGGGAIANGSELKIIGGNYTGNYVSGDDANGGAIHNAGNLEIHGGTYTGNFVESSTSAYGGAIYNMKQDNKLAIGGNIYIAPGERSTQNDIYLGEQSVITITEPLTNGNPKIARIETSRALNNNPLTELKILKTEDGSGVNLATECGKFIVESGTNTIYPIQTDGYIKYGQQ